MHVYTHTRTHTHTHTYIYTYVCIKECVRSLIHCDSTRPCHSIGDWVTNFGEQIGFEALTPSKIEFAKFHALPFFWGVDVKNTFSSITRLQIIS